MNCQNRTRVLITAALMGGFFMPAPAAAEPVCGQRDAIARLLRTEFGERPVADAVTAWGRHLVLFTAPDGATWSIVVTDPGGVSCLIAAGVDWRSQSLAQSPDLPDLPQPDTRTRLRGRSRSGVAKAH